MIMRVFPLAALVLVAASAWAQGDPGQPAGNQNPGVRTPPAETPTATDESEMAPPPPVSGTAFPVSFVSPERSNYLSIGVTGGAAYGTNVLPGVSAVPINDEIYSVWPSINFDRVTERFHENFAYSPGFQFYQHTSALNQSTQSAAGALDYRPTPHSLFNLHDDFAKTANVFSTPYSLTGGTVSGSAGLPATLVIAPYADQITNDGGGLFSYQFSRDAMIGAGGGATELDFPDTTETTGLYNANTYDGSAFYNQRLSRRHYAGVAGDYFDITEYPAAGTGNGETRTSAIMPFYTYSTKSGMTDARSSVTVSLAGGVQYHDVAFPGAPVVTGWSPVGLASVHAESPRATFSLSYQRTTTAGGGLLGAFTTNAARTDLRLRLTPTWTLGASGGYTNNKEIVPVAALIGEGGHSITVAGSVVHDLSQNLAAEVGYDFLHQDYALVPLIAIAPDSQRVYGTLRYHLRRPLGR